MSQSKAYCTYEKKHLKHLKMCFKKHFPTQIKHNNFEDQIVSFMHVALRTYHRGGGVEKKMIKHP